MKAKFCTCLMFLNLFIAVVGLVVLTDSLSKNTASTVNAAEDAKPQKITASEINLVDQNGKVRMTLAATNDGGGIWVYGKSKNQFVTMYGSESHGPYVSVADIDAKNYRKHTAFQYAVGLNSDSEPYFQILDKTGELKMLDPLKR